MSKLEDLIARADLKPSEFAKEARVSVPTLWRLTQPNNSVGLRMKYRVVTTLSRLLNEKIDLKDIEEMAGN